MCVGFMDLFFPSSWTGRLRETERGREREKERETEREKERKKGQREREIFYVNVHRLHGPIFPSSWRGTERD